MMKSPSLSAALAAACLLCAACSDSSDDDKSTDTGTESSGNVNIDEDALDDDAPVISNAVIRAGGYCYVEADYDDKQGPADVRRGMIYAIDRATGEEVWADPLYVCRDYACVGSFGDQPQYSGWGCGAADALRFEGQLEDRSGLLSERVELRME